MTRVRFDPRHAAGIEPLPRIARLTALALPAAARGRDAQERGDHVAQRTDAAARAPKIPPKAVKRSYRCTADFFAAKGTPCPAGGIFVRIRLLSCLAVGLIAAPLLASAESESGDHHELSIGLANPFDASTSERSDVKDQD